MDQHLVPGNVCGSVCVRWDKLSLPRKTGGERVLMKKWDLLGFCMGKPILFAEQISLSEENKELWPLDTQI